ncbi:hypothetical protein [Marinobacterium aestuariivivens]|uniref:Double Cache domain-containing protein n=1 Tax=Marinobacterium aestuariivivens TaxID=1698799 RepID=A0ABW2A698_9GAMM
MLSSIRLRLIALISLLLLVAMGTTTWLNVHLENALITERLTGQELPARLQAIRNDVLADIRPVIARSRQLAANPFMIEWLEAGEPDDGRKALVMRHLAKLAEDTGADTVFLRTAGRHSAFDQAGQQASFDRRDAGYQWFFRMLDGNDDEELVFDVDLTGQARFFVDIAVRNDQGSISVWPGSASMRARSPSASAATGWSRRDSSISSTPGVLSRCIQSWRRASNSWPAI